MTKSLFALLLVWGFTLVNCQGDRQSDLLLHVPSPDWSEQVIYFVMTDRFNDGDPSNNDHGGGEYDPEDRRKFSGGDLQGIIDKLDYIQSLGATALWITPPVANQWWNPGIEYGGYHGYWAIDFESVDPHLGSLDTYKRLSSELHKRGMYLVQDIVTNHTGDFFYYKPGYDPADPTKHVHHNSASTPAAAPTQAPFHLNDVRVPEHREADIYHWTPDIAHYQDEHQRLQYQLSGLDDLNTENPVVREALKKAYSYWISEVGVDGYRIDTIIYVDHDFWHNFVHSENPAAPGIDLAARASGRDNFLTFGEAFIGALPYNDEGDRAVAAYLGTPAKPELDAVLTFPLHYSLRRALAEGAPSGYLGYRLRTLMNKEIYPNPFVLPHFLDNHDIQRFLSIAEPIALKQGLLVLMSIPGIPVIYQGTEQQFEKQRASMFAGGYGSAGKNHFDEMSPMFQFIQSLSNARRSNPVLTQGNLTVLHDSQGAPGALVYQRQLGTETALVILNTANKPVILSNLQTEQAKPQHMRQLAGWDLPEELNFDSEGKLTMELPARSAAIYITTDRESNVASSSTPITISTNLQDKILRSDILLRGHAPTDIGPLKVIVDGFAESGTPVQQKADGNWTAEVDVGRFPIGKSIHSLAIFAADAMLSSDAIQITVDLPEPESIITIDDPAGDDRGPTGSYTIPTDVSYGAQMDIRQVEVATLGGNLQIRLTMGAFSDVWLPPNGFDHAAFHIFLDLPNKEGSSILPRLNASAPSGLHWDYLFYAGGWSSGLIPPWNG